MRGSIWMAPGKGGSTVKDVTMEVYEGKPELSSLPISNVISSLS